MSYPFIETEFGLLPPRKHFFIPSPFRAELYIPRPFYGNKNFLEILKEQPSLYEEHLFLYRTAGDSLYKKLLERLESGKMVEERTKKFVVGKNCAINSSNKEDIQKLYRVTSNDKTFIYDKRNGKQFSEMIENHLDIIVRMNGITDFNFLQHSFSGNSLKKAFQSLIEKTLYMIEDTIKIYCDGKISTDSKVYLEFLGSALEVASKMTKQYSYLIPLRGNSDMICDLEKRYGKDIIYVDYDYDLKILSDKNHLLSVHLSPNLFQKIEPFVNIFTEKISGVFSVYEDILSNYIDIDTPERDEFLREINNLLSEFYKNILTLGEEDLKEFLVETTLFEKYDEDRIAVMKNMNKMIRVIIDEYTEYYRKRDRFLIFPSKEDKFYKKIIKKGTMLYRGYKGIYKNPINLNNSYSFFALHPIHLTTYFIPQPKEANKLEEYKKFIGGIATYVLRQDIEVMDFSNISSVRFMKKILEDEDAPKKVVKAFETSWKILDSDESNERFSRCSIENEDLTFIEWLCNKGYGGYVGIDVGEMHDEIAICFSGDSESILDYIGTIDVEKYMNFPLSEEPYRSHPELNLLTIIPTV